MKTADRNFSPAFSLVMAIVGVVLMSIAQAEAQAFRQTPSMPDWAQFSATPDMDFSGIDDGLLYDLHFEESTEPDEGVWI